MPPPPPPPGPPPAPGPPPPSKGGAPKGGGSDKSALLKSIQQGARLKKTVTNDRSSPLGAGGAKSPAPGGGREPSQGRPGPGGGGGLPTLPGIGGMFSNGMPTLKSTRGGVATGRPAGMPSVRSEKREVTPPNKWGGGPVSSSSSSSLSDRHRVGGSQYLHFMRSTSSLSSAAPLPSPLAQAPPVQRSCSSSSLAPPPPPVPLTKAKSSTFISPDNPPTMYNTRVTLTLRRSHSRLQEHEASTPGLQRNGSWREEERIGGGPKPPLPGTKPRLQHSGAPVIARNGRIQRFSYNCSTQYSRVNLRRTGFFGPLHPEGPVASPWPSPSSVSSSTSRTSVTSLGSTNSSPSMSPSPSPVGPPPGRIAPSRTPTHPNVRPPPPPSPAGEIWRSSCSYSGPSGRQGPATSATAGEWSPTKY